MAADLLLGNTNSTTIDIDCWFFIALNFKFDIISAMYKIVVL
jgi:hypothetical protein